MNTAKFLIGALALILLTVGGGVIHGKLSHRWGPPDRLLAAGARLQHIPDSAGTWKVESTQQLPDSARTMLECAGDVSRNYLDSAGGANVSLTLLLGPAGPMAAHSPEICFSSRDFREIEERQQIDLEDAAGVVHQLWRVTFQSQGLNRELLNVYYAWSTGGAWRAPDNARIEFAGSPYLYKFQVIGYSVSQSPSASDPALSFLREFLPVVSTELEQPASSTH